MKYKIGAYVRISTEEAAQVLEGSISSQKHRIQSWIELKNVQQENWGNIVETYSDEGISAKDMNRPAFQKMMSDLQKGKINLILVTELSRLSRSISDFCHILEELKKYKAGFLSIKEQFDTSTPAGEMMVFNMINLAQFERKQVAERVSLNFHSRALRGLINGGQPPLGYDKDPEKRCTYIINKAEATQVSEIFQTYLIEGSLSKTVKKLNECGVQPKQRSKRNQWQTWNVKNLNQLLRNLSYVGKKEVNVKYKNEDQSALKAFQKYCVVKASWESIIDENIFQEVQLRLTEAGKNERDRLSKGVFNIYWLSGIIKCPDCGKKYVGSCSHGKNEVHRYYLHPGTSKEMSACSFKRIRADEIEKNIENHLIEILNINGHFDHLQKNIETSYNSNIEDSLTEQNHLKKKESQLSEDLEKLFELHLSSQGMSKEIIHDRIEKIGHSRKQVQIRLAELEQKNLMAREYENASKQIKNHILEFNRGWKKATGAEKKRLARKVLSRLIPTEVGLEVYYFMGTENLSENDNTNANMGSEAQKQKNQVLSLVSVGSDIVKVGWGRRT